VRHTSTDRMVSHRHWIITSIEDRIAATTNIRLSVIITQDPIAAVIVTVMNSSRYSYMTTIWNPVIILSTGDHWRMERRRMKN